ncbi:hypothetical protein HK405_013210, partial [Cladochytrium tenue]
LSDDLPRWLAASDDDDSDDDTSDTGDYGDGGVGGHPGLRLADLAPAQALAGCDCLDDAHGGAVDFAAVAEVDTPPPTAPSATPTVPPPAPARAPAEAARSAARRGATALATTTSEAVAWARDMLALRQVRRLARSPSPPPPPHAAAAVGVRSR